MGYAIGANDGPIGIITDFLFDDVTWRVRWLVVDTGTFLRDRRVLLPPSALTYVNHIGHQLSVSLTRQQIKDSPNISTDEPVSGQMETDLYDYYGWSPYWSTGFYMGGYAYSGALFAPATSIPLPPRQGDNEDARRQQGDRHLRSVRELMSYNIHASDGDIGQVADFLLEDGDWSIRYLVIDTHGWWSGKKVLISPRSIESTNWSTQTVNINVDRQDVRDSPEYDGSQAIDRAYEYQFHGYYDGRRIVEPI
jgi:hypothetical protein